MAPPIPDRWIPYKACGKVIEGTRFICFKVPLRKAVQVGKSDIKEIWDIKTLLETIPKLGAVIDLTNTSRYYDPRELKAAGILHQKILMPGRIIPPEKKVSEFMDTVDEYLGRDCVAVEVKRARLDLSTTEFLIGVHCTHGLNRTGYMVCRYMRDRLNIPAKTAIKRFEKARGYEIERENYIADLLGKVPPPPDLNFQNKHTEVRPVRDGDRDRRNNMRHEDEDNPASERKEKKTSNRNKRKAKSERGGSKGDGEVENWRSEPRSSKNNECRDVWDSWNKGKKIGESSSQRKNSTTDSERSFDYRYDY